MALIKSLVMSRLDYSNGLLYGLPKCTVSGLQAVQNSTTRIVSQERLRDHDYMCVLSDDLSSGKWESTHPSRAVVRSIKVFYGVSCTRQS